MGSEMCIRDSTMGEATTASCVVFEKGSPKTSEYRQFNIKDITPGDDYAAINQAVFRRYSRLQEANKEMPDIVRELIKRKKV